MEKLAAQPRRFLAAVGATLIVAGVGVAVTTTLDGPGDVGQRPAPETVAGGGPEPGVDQEEADREETGPAPVPERLSSADLDLSAPVEQVGVDDERQVEVPDDVSRVGWYRFGPEPGADGSAVLAGHVDSADQGRGAFWPLGEAAVDDVVTVHLSDGTARDFRVVAREQIDKAELPAEELFAREGEPRLTLITCGGEFDAADSSYTDNVVVTARPLEDT